MINVKTIKINSCQVSIHENPNEWNQIFLCFPYLLIIRRYMFSVYLRLKNLHVNFDNRNIRYYTFLFSYIHEKVGLKKKVRFLSTGICICKGVKKNRSF